MLALPGSAYLYQGEELGLENVDVPEDLRQDPAWLRTHSDWRDGCRIPLPWSGDEPPYGFGPGAGQPWLPQPLDWADRSVAAEEQDPDSTLAFYKAALAARRKHTSETSEDVELLDAGADLLAFTRGDLTVVLNAGADAVELPAGDVVVGQWGAGGPAAARGHRGLAREPCSESCLAFLPRVGHGRRTRARAVRPRRRERG